MKGNSLVDRLTDVDASEGLRAALRTVLSCDFAIQDAITDSDLLLRLADAIGYEYLPRPKWMDGTPVHEGDWYEVDGDKDKVCCFRVDLRVNHSMSIMSGDVCNVVNHIEPDTQERIDDDSVLCGSEYVSDVLERSTTNMSSYETQQLMVQDLLRRQRELDGRE